MKIPEQLDSWLRRVLSWAEMAGAFWARFWLLVVGGLLVLGSVILKWVQSPFTHNLTGLNLSLVSDPGINPHIALLSVGLLGVLVLIAGLVFQRTPAILA